jgi:hypothetical protein
VLLAEADIAAPSNCDRKLQQSLESAWCPLVG